MDLPNTTIGKHMYRIIVNNMTHIEIYNINIEYTFSSVVLQFKATILNIVVPFSQTKFASISRSKQEQEQQEEHENPGATVTVKRDEESRRLLFLPPYIV
ncbi:hypothetical protein ACJX0J_023043, partial [Zea mays]